MHKLLIPIIAAGSALAIAAPASAQWAPPAYRNQPYNYAHGFNGYRFAGAMQQRVERIRRDIRSMRERRMLSWREARPLENEARSIQRRIWIASRNGIQPGEARNLERRIRNLEWRVSREASDRNNRPGHYRRY